jgi:hypothetical protein
MADSPNLDRCRQAQRVPTAVFATHAGAPIQSICDELALRMLSVGIDWTTWDVRRACRAD